MQTGDGSVTGRAERAGGQPWRVPSRARLKSRCAAVSAHVPLADEIHEFELVTLDAVWEADEVLGYLHQ
jgi:hypothetical protein